MKQCWLPSHKYFKIWNQIFTSINCFQFHLCASFFCLLPLPLYQCACFVHFWISFVIACGYRCSSSLNRLCHVGCELKRRRNGVSIRHSNSHYFDFIYKFSATYFLMQTFLLSLHVALLSCFFATFPPSANEWAETWGWVLLCQSITPRTIRKLNWFCVSLRACVCGCGINDKKTANTLQNNHRNDFQWLCVVFFRFEERFKTQIDIRLIRKWF